MCVNYDVLAYANEVAAHMAKFAILYMVYLLGTYKSSSLSTWNIRDAYTRCQANVTCSSSRLSCDSWPVQKGCSNELVTPEMSGKSQKCSKSLRIC